MPRRSPWSSTPDPPPTEAKRSPFAPEPAEPAAAPPKEPADAKPKEPARDDDAASDSDPKPKAKPESSAHAATARGASPASPPATEPAPEPAPEPAAKPAAQPRSAKPRSAAGGKRTGTKGERTRARLLDATLTLVARRGVGAFTVREVVKEAGSSLGVLTYHFPARQDLLLAAFERQVARQAERAVAVEAKLGDFTAPNGRVDLDALTDAVIDLLTDMVHADRDTFLIRHELDLEAIRDPELAERLAAAPSAHRLALEEILRAAGSTQPSVDAQLLGAAFDGLGREWLRHPDDREFDAQVGLGVRRLLEKFFA